MKIIANTPEEYISQLEEERQIAISELRKVILKNIPKGFHEEMSYGMIGYVVPKSIYPNGYHCDTKLPLPFITIASQKNFIALYHMGIYMDEALMEWFVTEFPKHSNKKLDMGKSCIRFKNTDQLPLKLIGELVSKMTVKNWIALYESKLKK